MGSGTSFMNPDLPIELRVPLSFLFGLKRLLCEWDFKKSSVYIDTEAFGMNVEGKAILQAGVDNHTLHLRWLDAQWQGWQQLIDDPKYKALLTDNQEKLDKARAGRSEGKGRASA